MYQQVYRRCDGLVFACLGQVHPLLRLGYQRCCFALGVHCCPSGRAPNRRPWGTHMISPAHTGTPGLAETGSAPVHFFLRKQMLTQTDAHTDRRLQIMHAHHIQSFAWMASFSCLHALLPLPRVEYAVGYPHWVASFEVAWLDCRCVKLPSLPAGLNLTSRIAWLR